MPDPYASPRDPSARDVRAIIMAGGKSERMRATHGPRHKALVEVGGIPLIERNLRALFAEAFDEIIVIAAPGEPEIAQWVNERGAALARRCGARIDTYVETQPLGNIGIARILSDGKRDLLVTYVDNLSTLSARALLAHHRRTGATLTIATHLFALQNPFGELDIADGFIRAYREKPVRPVAISSGTCVIAPSAAALIPAGRAFGATDLCGAALAAGLPVAAYAHAEPWIDVNDAAALERAERLVAEYRERFES